MLIRDSALSRITRIILFKLKMLLSDRTLLVAMIVFPVFFAWVSGYTVRKEASAIPGIVLVDEDLSPLSENFADMISSYPGIRVDILEREEAFERLKAGKVEGVFIIPRGFGKKMESGDMRSLFEYTILPSSYSEGYFMEVFAGRIITLSSRIMSVERCAETFREAGLDIPANFKGEATAYFDSHWSEGPPMSTVYTEVGTSSKMNVSVISMPVAEMTAAGMMLVFTMFYVMAGSGWLIDEREQDTLKRLHSAPRALAISHWGGAIALFLSGGLQMAGSFLIFRIVSGRAIASETGQYLILLLYLLSAVSVSMLFSSIFSTRNQLQAFIPVFTIATGFLGGCFWSLPYMPAKMQRLALLTPQGWTLEGLRRLLPEGHMIGSVYMPFLALGLLTLILLPLSYKIMMSRLDSH